MGNKTTNKNGISSWGDENVLKLTVVDGGTTLNILKTINSYT